MAAAAAAPPTFSTCLAWEAAGAGRRASAAPRTWCTSELRGHWLLLVCRWSNSLGIGAGAPVGGSGKQRASVSLLQCGAAFIGHDGTPFPPSFCRMKVSLEEMYKGSTRKLQMTRRWVQGCWGGSTCCSSWPGGWARGVLALQSWPPNRRRHAAVGCNAFTCCTVLTAVGVPRHLPIAASSATSAAAAAARAASGTHATCVLHCAVLWSLPWTRAVASCRRS